MFEITRFLNVSMIVRDLDAAIARYADVFGLTCGYRVEVPAMACDSAILPVGGGVSYSLELVEAMDMSVRGSGKESDSTYSEAQAEQIIRRFLERRGEGVYRLAFEVADFAAARAHLEEKGVRYTHYTLEMDPVTSEVLIVHPAETFGVMFEFLPPGVYEQSSNHASWPSGTGIFRRFLNTSCAVRDLPAATKDLEDLFGLTPGGVITVPEMAVDSVIYTIGGDAALELFAPMPPDRRDAPRYNPAAQAALENYFERRGEGIYRLALEVDDYDAALARLDERNISYVPFDLALDTGPLRVAVVSPRAMHGVMFELCEPDNPAYAPPAPSA